MSKQVNLLICFVLVLGLGSNVLAFDMNQPDFAGCDQSAAVLWEFEDGNSNTGEASDKPSLIFYDSDPPDACFGFRTYGSDYEGGCDPNNAFAWSSNGTVVIKGEESVAQPIPLGEGANLTVQVQITWQGPNFPPVNGPGLGFELWGGYPEKANEPCPLREGEWMDGVFNEDETGESFDFLPFLDIPNYVEGIWRQTTYLYTFENFPEETTHFNVLFFGFINGTAGMLIDEVVVDMIVHDGDPPTPCPGRPWLRIPRAGQARDPVPAHLAEHVVPDTNLAWAPDPCLAGPLTYDVWFGTDPCMANNTKIASNIGANTVDPCAGDLAAGTVFYWRVDTNDPGREGIDFKFTTWGLADDVYPADGATGADPPVVLEWGPDGYAATCDIYLGTSFAEVNDATTSHTNQFKGNQAVSDANYNAGMLDLLKTYYWRIDEKNVGGTAIKGDVWRFTTGANFVLEDFDRYATNTQLYDVWDDYWVNGTNAEIFVETDAKFTFDGNSLLYKYDSRRTTGKFPGSVADADIADMLVGSDWTISGIKSVLVHFRGTAGNSTTVNDRMWLELEDTSSNTGVVLYDGDMNNLAVEQWQEWNIDLAVYDACGVSLANVDKIHLGFAGDRIGQSVAGGTGQVYFDEIELHPRRCRPEFTGPKGDLDEDCVVDGYDVDVFSTYWLDTEYAVPPVPPDDNMLELEYLFDTDYSDTSGNNRHGTAVVPGNISASGGILTISAEGSALQVPFDTLGPNPFDGSVDFSINIEYRASTPYSEAGVLMSNTDPNGPNDPNLRGMTIFLNGEATKAGDIRAAHYDNFWMSGARAEANGLPDGTVWDANWHDIAVTYDADGGICSDDWEDPNLCPPGTVTGLLTVYLDSDYFAIAEFDPNIPGISDDEVIIGLTKNDTIAVEDIGTAYYVGDINDVRVYSYPLSHSEVAWLAGKAEPTCYGVYGPANWVPSGLGPCEDANNPDIINFLDYETLAENWLTGPYLWP